MESKDRILWIDFAKGLGIILVMIGHTTMYTPVTIVYFCHMPLFFFLSGYVTSKKSMDTKGFVLKKVKRLLIPYYVLGAVMLLCNTIQGLYQAHWSTGYFHTNFFRDALVEYLTQDRFGTLWYIAVLFWMSLLFFAIYKACRGNAKAMFVVSLVMLAIGFIYYGLGGGSLPGNIDVAFTMMIFFFLGYHARNGKLFERPLFAQHPLRSFIIFVAASFVAGGVNWLICGYHVDIYYNFYGIPPLMYASSFLGILAIVALSLKANWFRPLNLLGENSMVFYAWHQCMIFPLTLFVLEKLHLFQSESVGARTVSSLLCIALSLLVLSIPTLFLRKVKWGRWFGIATVKQR